MKSKLGLWSFCGWIVYAVLLTPGWGADRFWLGPGNWSQTAQWSTTSGGSGGASVPGTSDRAIFDENSGNCAVNANADVGGLLLTNWTAALTLSDTNTFQVRGSFYQDSGTIACGTNLFTFYHHSPNFAGGTFTPNASGWVRFQNAGTAAGYTITGAPPVFENVSFYTSGGGGTYPWIIPAGSTVTVNRAVIFEGVGYNRLNTGTLVVKGSITNYNGEQNASANLVLSGSGDQTLHGTAFLPNLIINKPSGRLTLVGTNKTSRNWTHLAGDVDPGVSTVILYPHNSFASGITSTTGRATFYNLSFDQYVGGGSSYYYDLYGDLVLEVSNTLSFGLANIFNGGTLRSGSLEALGDVIVNVHYGNSTTLLKIKGANAQTMTGTKASYEAAPPPVVIDKASGTLNLDGTFSLFNTWTHLAGTVNPGTSYVWMLAYTTPKVVLTSAVGRVVFYDVRMDQTAGGGANYNIDLTGGTTLVVTNRLMFDATSGFAVRNSRVEVYGSLSNEASYVGGTTLLSLVGTNDQTLATASPYSQIAVDLEVDKAGGVVTLDTPVTFSTANKDVTVKGGTLNVGTNRWVLSANGSDFRMTNAASKLMTTVADGTNGMVAVTGTGVARIDGELWVTVAPGYTSNPMATNIILAAASGPVQNTPFLAKRASHNYQFTAFYNESGNRVVITGLAKQSGGTLIEIR